MIQVIHRALDIVEFIARDRSREYGLSEIADSLGLNHGTCANIIKTLVGRGYLQQSGKKRGYKLGPQAYYLTGNFSNKRELLKVASKSIEALNEKLNESCILAVRKENMRVTLLKKLSTHELQVVDNREERHVYLTATGRVILACMSRPEQERFIEKYGLPGEMWEEVKSKEDLLEELDKIKAKRLAVHFAGEHIVGVGAPVFKGGRVIASVGVYLPEVRFSYKMQEMIFSEILKTADEIGEALGRMQ
jgi:DNA-binding IclR family transcriptional regulator